MLILDILFIYLLRYNQGVCMKKVILVFLLVNIINQANAKEWFVGPFREYTYFDTMSSLVADGDTISLDYGTFQNNPQITWTKNNLLIRGIEGIPEISAGSLIANDHTNGKAIFVIQGSNNTVENIIFMNCKVPDNNGAGIRQEGSNLTVRHCIFSNNEMGILAGNISNCKILVEYCKFENCGSTDNPGYQHNIYINHIDTLIFRFNSSINAIAEGHEFKSRATNNFILYNKISNLSSEDSRNIDIPNGGTAIIMGNIIEQNQQTANSNIIGFGLEGLTNPGKHSLYIVNNTIVNRKDRGSFVQVADIDSLYLVNNILVGAKTGGLIIGNPASLDSSNNLINDDVNTPLFISEQGIDYKLSMTSPAINNGLQVDKSVMGMLLVPNFSYSELNDYEIRNNIFDIDIGAYEFINYDEVNSSNMIDNSIIISPNPAIDIIKVNMIEISDKYRVKIYSISGELVFENEYYSQIISIPTFSLSSGIYIIEVNNHRAGFVKR